MITQVQCSNCQSFKVERETKRINPETGNEVYKASFMSGCFMAIVLFFAFDLVDGIIIGGIFPHVFGETSAGQALPFIEGILILLFILPIFVLPIVIPVRAAKKKNKEYERGISVTTHYCTQCGKKW